MMMMRCCSTTSQCTYKVGEVVALEEAFSKVTVLLDAALGLAALKPVAFDNGTNFGLQLPPNMGATRGNLTHQCQCYEQ